MQEVRIMLQRIETEFLEFRIVRMVFSYVGEYQLIMYNEMTIYSRGGKEMITTTHAYGDAGYLIQGKKNKRKDVRCREAMLVTKIKAASPKGLLQGGRNDLNTVPNPTQLQRGTRCGGSGSTNG